MVRHVPPRGQRYVADCDIPAPDPGLALLVRHDDGCSELYLSPEIRLAERDWPADTQERVFARSLPPQHRRLLLDRYSRRLIVPTPRTPEGREALEVLRMLGELDPLTLTKLDALALATGRTLAETLTHYYRVRTGGAP